MKEYILLKELDSNTIKLALSRSNIYNSKFVSVDGPVTVNSNKLELIIILIKKL